MKKEIKVNYLDEQIDNLQNEYEEYIQQKTEKNEETEEKTEEKTIKEININTIRLALIASGILFIGLLFGMWTITAMSDTTIQDNIQKIEQSTKQINYLTGVIQKAQKGIIIEKQNISKAKQILKSKNLEYIKK